MKTNNFNLSQILQNQSGKELIINENNFVIDSLMFCRAKSFIATLPSNANDGDVYIIETNASENLTENIGNIAIHHINFGFRFIKPKNGMVFFITENNKFYRYFANNWIEVALGGAETVENPSIINDLLDSSEIKTYSIDKLKTLFVNNALLNQYAKSSELTQYLTNNDLINYAKISDLSDFLTLATLPSEINDSLNLSTTKTYSIDKIKSIIQDGGYSIGDFKSSTQSSNHGKWLLCNGSTVSRTTYELLKNQLTFAIIGNTTINSNTISNLSTTNGLSTGFSIEGSGIQLGTTIVSIVNSTTITISKNATITSSGISITVFAFGNGDGLTTLNLPDFRGRVFGAIGQGNGLTNRNLGDKIGEEAITLTIAQIPAHTHGLNSAGGGVVNNQGGSNGAGGGASRTVSYATDSSGGGGSHNNMQPTLFGGNVFIFSGV